MTITEKLAMFKEKKDFIENLNKAFQTFPKGLTVASVKYEVYRKDTKDTTYFTEYIVVTFFGGAISVRTVNGNSNSANFRTIGSMLDGGYYDEVQDYEKLKDIGYEKVNLNSRRFVLAELLCKSMTHISDVTRCFEYCANVNDIEKVIRVIPGSFGCFEAEFSEDGKSFRIINTYDDGGVLESEEYEFDFYQED